MPPTRIIDQLLGTQRGLVATWQLLDAGVAESTANDQVSALRTMFSGVHLSGHAPPSPWQLAFGATLTTPDSALDSWAALQAAGLSKVPWHRIGVVRPGSAGPRVWPARGTDGVDLAVRYSTSLEGDRLQRDGIPMLTVPRAVRELMTKLNGERRDHLVRDVLRLKLTTPHELWAQVARHHGARGVAILRALVDEYAPLDLGRERSDAEVVARLLLHAAGVTEFELNRVLAGHEADLVSIDRRLILELDGPQFHQFLTRDARIQAAWEGAGFVVRRLPTDDVYEQPHRLLTAATTPVSDKEWQRIAETKTAADILARWSEHGRYEWSARRPR